MVKATARVSALTAQLVDVVVYCPHCGKDLKGVVAIMCHACGKGVPSFTALLHPVKKVLYHRGENTHVCY